MKIKITENQFKKIKQLTENYLDLSDRYEDEIDVYFFYSSENLKFKGKKISSINNSKMTLYFYIDISARTFGIEKIEVINIKGDDIIDCEYEDEDEINGTFELKFDWDNLDIIHDKHPKLIGLDDTLYVYLTNDNAGNIVVEKIEITVYDLT